MKHVVITGANRGIGFQFAKQYSEAGYKVTAVCRNNSKQLTALDVDIIEGIDVTKESDLLRMKESMAASQLISLLTMPGCSTMMSLAILMAAACARSTKSTPSRRRVTDALLDNLSDGSKVGLITNRMGSIADNGSGSRYGYRMSKAALNAAGKSLALDLKDQGLRWYCCIRATYKPTWLEIEAISLPKRQLDV